MFLGNVVLMYQNNELLPLILCANLNAVKNFLFVNNEIHSVKAVGHTNISPNKFRYSFVVIILVQNIVSGSDYKVVFWAHSTKDMNISIAFTSSDGKRLLAQKHIGYVYDESETYLVCQNCLKAIFTEVKI